MALTLARARATSAGNLGGRRSAQTNTTSSDRATRVTTTT